MAYPMCKNAADICMEDDVYIKSKGHTHIENSIQIMTLLMRGWSLSRLKPVQPLP